MLIVSGGVNHISGCFFQAFQLLFFSPNTVNETFPFRERMVSASQTVPLEENIFVSFEKEYFKVVAFLPEGFENRCIGGDKPLLPQIHYKGKA